MCRSIGACTRTRVRLANRERRDHDVTSSLSHHHHHMVNREGHQISTITSPLSHRERRVCARTSVIFVNREGRDHMTSHHRYHIIAVTSSPGSSWSIERGVIITRPSPPSQCIVSQKCSCTYASMCVHACVRACVRACERARRNDFPIGTLSHKASPNLR